MHVSPTTAPTYLYAARQRMGFYPPSAPPSSYYTPWLWLDGDQSPGYNTSSWSTYITNRLSAPSPITESLWGEYNLQTGNGTIYGRFQNDSNATVNANIVFVITEDNITYMMPNGDNTHNHVARAYIPSYTGVPVSIPSGSQQTVSYPFTILPSWNLHNLEIIAFIQNQTLVGSTKEILQGAKSKIEDLIGIEEPRNDMPITASKVSVLPNPGINGTRFAFSLPMGTEYKINIFDVTGRTIKTLKGTGSGQRTVVKCELSEAGVYLYRFESNTLNTTGKIIVK